MFSRRNLCLRASQPARSAPCFCGRRDRSRLERARPSRSPRPTRNGRSCSRPSSTTCCASTAPSVPSPARSTRSTAPAPTPAPAAICRCSPPPPSSTAAPAGRASMRRSTNAIGTTSDRSLGHGAHRGALPPLRRPSGPRFRRRAQAHGTALLHERRGAQVHCGEEIVLSGQPEDLHVDHRRDRRWLAPSCRSSPASPRRRPDAPAPKPRRCRHGDLRRRLLLVRRGGLREGAGRASAPCPATSAAPSPKPTYEQVSRRPPAMRGGAGDLRSGQGELPAARRLVLAQHRSGRCPRASSATRAARIARAIFYHDEAQKKVAEASKQALEASGRFKEPIATKIVACGPVLGGRGLPPGLLQEEPAPLSVLQDGVRPRRSGSSRSGASPSRRPVRPRSSVGWIERQR